MGKMQRTKGATYERHIANRLRQVYPGAKRGIGQARSASEVPDVDGTPWWVECKHQKVVNVLAALAQAEVACACSKPPLVIARRNRERDVAVLYLDDLIELLQALEDKKTALDRQKDPAAVCRKAAEEVSAYLDKLYEETEKKGSL